MPHIRTAVLLVLVIFCAVPAALAQVTETAVAFDSAGKVRTLTPALVTRFDLRAPAWPVSGDFLEARLYDISTGGHVLAVERQDRRVERYPLTPDNVAALRFAIDAAMTRSGATVTEERSDMVSEPARGAFVRNQMLATWLIYGPSLSAMSGDPQAGTALYLLATGASYFITTGISRKTVVTRAQNHLATDGAMRGWGVGAGLVYTLAGQDAQGETYAAVGLAGALGGAITGFQRGKNLTDSESQAATSISNLMAATALGIGGATGLIEDGGEGRPLVGSIVAAGLAGYAYGPGYPRRAKYAVTKGDIQVTGLGAMLGTAIAVTPFVSEDYDGEPEPVFAVATAGLLLGTFFTESQWARKYDHTTWDAGQTSLAAGAGALMGAAAAVLTEPNAQVTYALVVAGATFGGILGHSLAAPARAGGSKVSMAPSTDRGRVSMRTNASALAFSAMGVPGRHALLSFSF